MFSRFSQSQSQRRGHKFTRPFLASASFFVSHARRSSCGMARMLLVQRRQHITRMVGKSTNPLDLFYLLLEQRVLVCRSCKAGVAPRHLVTHIRAHHRGLYSAFQTKQSAIEWVQVRRLPSLPCALLDPTVESIHVPPADTKAFPVLKVHVGYGCRYCPAVSKREDEISKHSLL